MISELLRFIISSLVSSQRIYWPQFHASLLNRNILVYLLNRERFLSIPAAASSDVIYGNSLRSCWLSNETLAPLAVELSWMTSSNGIIFRVTGPLCGEFTGHRWIPPYKGQWRWALMFSFICAWINGWVNNRKAGDLRRHRAHYDVTVVPEWYAMDQTKPVEAIVCQLKPFTESSWNRTPSVTSP